MCSQVAVNTNIKDMYEFLDHIIKITNMKSITPFTEDDLVRNCLEVICSFSFHCLLVYFYLSESSLAYISCLYRFSRSTDSVDS